MATQTNNTYHHDNSECDGGYATPDNPADGKTNTGHAYCNDVINTVNNRSESFLNSAPGKPHRLDRRLVVCLLLGLIFILTFVVAVVVVLVKISSDISDINSRIRQDRVQNDASFSEVRHTLNETKTSLDDQTAAATRRIDQLVTGNNLLKCRLTFQKWVLRVLNSIMLNTKVDTNSK